MVKHRPRKPRIPRWYTHGFLSTWTTQRITGELCATSRKIVTNKMFFCSSFKYLCKTIIFGLEMNSFVHFWHGQSVSVTCLLVFIWSDPWWRSLLQLICVAVTDGKVWKCLKNSGDFFLLLCDHLVVACRLHWSDILMNLNCSCWRIKSDVFCYFLLFHLKNMCICEYVHMFTYMCWKIIQKPGCSQINHLTFAAASRVFVSDSWASCFWYSAVVRVCSVSAF